MHVLLFAPIHNSLYARLVATGVLEEPGIELCGIVVRSHWNMRRFRAEFKRDRGRFLRKILNKFLIGDERYGSRPRDNLLGYAREQGLRFTSLKDISRKWDVPMITVSDLNSAKSRVFIENANPDVILFTGGGLIRKEVLDIPRIGVLNCHSGILPDYRGMDVVEWTAAEGAGRSVGFGVTQHLMDRGVDTGPILQKETIQFQKEDDFRSLREKIEVLMAKLMLGGLRGLRDGSITPVPQRLDAGRQYYVMHPRMMQYAESELDQLKAIE